MTRKLMDRFVSMEKHGCPICGYPDITVLDDFNLTTYEICECCGSESGVEYDQYSTPEAIAKARNEWVVENKCEWWGDKSSIPKGWEPYSQMKSAGIKVPNRD